MKKVALALFAVAIMLLITGLMVQALAIRTFCTGSRHWSKKSTSSAVRNQPTELRQTPPTPRTVRTRPGCGRSKRNWISAGTCCANAAPKPGSEPTRMTLRCGPSTKSRATANNAAPNAPNAITPLFRCSPHPKRPARSPATPTSGRQQIPAPTISPHHEQCDDRKELDHVAGPSLDCSLRPEYIPEVRPNKGSFIKMIGATRQKFSKPCFPPVPRNRGPSQQCVSPTLFSTKGKEAFDEL
ncbi:UNVERIFIED_ORG: hypothetical protein ABIB52_002518 [Arthrobacter sp. UYCu721]